MNFIQPSETSRVLNRVTGAEPSSIEGTLNANGIVYLVNPAGIVFGPNSVINVGALVAAAATITDEDFLKGVDRFVLSNGSVSVEGLLRAKQAVHIIARYIKNLGRISCPDGIVTMTSGDRIYAKQQGTNLLVELPTGDNSSCDSVGIVNEGTVEGSRIVFSSGDIYALALINRGKIKAEGGEVKLEGSEIVNEGSVDASSSKGKGGKIDFYGNEVINRGVVKAEGRTEGGRITLVGNERTAVQGYVTASGSAGGGEVNIGKGDRLRSSITLVGEEGEIEAVSYTHLTLPTKA